MTKRQRYSSYPAMFLVFSQFLCRKAGSTSSTCHRENEFVKVKQDGLPLISPIKIVTTSKRFFCSSECLDFQGCNSFAFLTKTSTNNCLLSSNADGVAVSSSDAEVYKRRVGFQTKGCDLGVCLNGGTCVDLCEESPSYFCNCPATYEGKNCEWDLNCFRADWTTSFDNAGTVQCPGDTNYLVGLVRSSCDTLGCIEYGNCCPAPLAFSKSGRTCQNADWWNSFGQNAWNLCHNGYFLTGFMRSSGYSVDIRHLEEGVCCKPLNGANTYSDCYTEDISISFDAEGADVRCSRPQYYIVGIETSGTLVFEIERFKCCKMG